MTKHQTTLKTLLSIGFLFTTLLFFQNCGVGLQSINEVSVGSCGQTTSMGVASSIQSLNTFSDKKVQFSVESELQLTPISSQDISSITRNSHSPNILNSPKLPKRKPIKNIDLSNASKKSPWRKIVKNSGKSDYTLDEDSEYMITINKECWSQNYNKSILTKNLKVKESTSFLDQNQTLPIKINQGTLLSDLEDISKTDSCVLGVSENKTYRSLAQTNDPKYAEQTHLNGIKFGETLNLFKAKSFSKPIVIAIIDTGLDLNHEDIKDHVWINQAEFNGSSGVDDDRNGYIDDINGYDFVNSKASPSPDTGNGSSHGTHTAGLAGAVGNNSKGGTGIMPSQVQLMPIKVLDGNGDGSTANVTEGIRYAYKNKANIINLSLGAYGNEDLALKQAIQEALAAGVTIIASAGNDRLNIEDTPIYPGSYAPMPGLITVGATGSYGNDIGRLCDFSNWSDQYVEIGAPGCHTKGLLKFDSNGNYTGIDDRGIYSTVQNNGYGYSSGTSMSAPIVAGAAGLVFGYVRENYKRVLRPAEVESIIINGSLTSQYLYDNDQEVQSELIKNSKYLNLSSIFNYIEIIYKNPGNHSPINLPGCPDLPSEKRNRI